MYFSTVTNMKKRFIDEDNKRIGTPHWIISHEFRMCSKVTCGFSSKYLSLGRCTHETVIITVQTLLFL
jgi:hypothetical protein